MTKRIAFRQADLDRALRSVNRAGLKVQRIEIDADGRIVVVTAEADQRSATATAIEAWRAERARAKGEKERAKAGAGTRPALDQPARGQGRRGPAPPVARP